MTSAQFNGAQFDEDAVPEDRVEGATTQDEELGQRGHHRRSTEPRLSYTRGRVETVAWSAAVLAGVVLAMAHGVHGTAHHSTPGGNRATATTSNNGILGCVTAGGRPTTDQPPPAEDGSRHPRAVRTDLPRCATEDQRAAESAYLARLVAQQNAAHASRAATRPRSR
jgi:hypothetical protein